jgi:hypothetical protein
MGLISLGDSVVYQTDYDYGAAESRGGKPLPFPPVDVWCVLLVRGEDSDATTGIFVALHQDLHNADWVIHRGWKDLSVREFDRMASAVGCRLEAR